MSDETASSPIVGFRTLLTKTVDGVLSEKVLFSFFENGDVDPARPQRTVVGRLKLAPARSVNPAARNTMNWQIEMTAGTAELAISMSLSTPCARVSASEPAEQPLNIST